MVSYMKTMHTAWPVGTPQSIKDAVEKFFQLLDGYSIQSAKQWSQLYCPNGEFQAFGKVFKGHEEIEQHILRFWASFSGLNHTPRKVYIHDHDYTDLTIITTYEIMFSNGVFVSEDSAATFKLEKQNGEWCIRANRLILDPNPLMSGLASVSESQDQVTTQTESMKPVVTYAENVLATTKLA